FQKHSADIVYSLVKWSRLMMVVGSIYVLIAIFLFVNSLMILTFFKKAAFFTNTRYIFFAHALVCDSIFLALSDALLVMSYSRAPMTGGLCILLVSILGILSVATPLTLTAMSLERYVAICMPLRHSELSTPMRAIYSILLIQALSSVNRMIIMSILFSAVSLRFYTNPLICSTEQMIVFPWQGHISSALSQLYFLVMSLVIAFTYVKILAASRAASSERKTSTNKGLRTVILHGFQLLLCLIQFVCPLIESIVMKINFNLFMELRYFDYIFFILAPRCLSPLVYGLRDKDFMVVLKYYGLKHFQNLYFYTDRFV
uniref:G-protein coupled receptors family 1 profile domain-containing protein n=1 Tax=Esox lucius TaxID=8010 RepID=A0AAY5JY20_ESOLU